MKRKLSDRIFDWLHFNAKLSIGQVRIFHMGLLTAYADTGKVLSLSFLGGAGYVPFPRAYDYTWVRGFTVYLRLDHNRYRKNDRTRIPFPLFVVTTNPNKYRV